MESDEQKPKDLLENQIDFQNEFRIKGETDTTRNENDFEIKKETEDVLENVKEEPLDEEQFEQNVPKFEEATEPCTSDEPIQEFRSNNPIQKFYMERKRMFPGTDPKASRVTQIAKRTPIVCRTPVFEEKPVQFSRNEIELVQAVGDGENDSKITDSRKRVFPKHQKTAVCSVCSRVESTQQLKHTSHMDELFVIILGCVLRGEYTPHEAKSFFARKIYGFICHSHFFNVFNEICKALLITKLDDIATSSLTLFQNLMPTVLSFCPKFTTWQLRLTLNNVTARNIYFLEMHVSHRMENIMPDDFLEKDIKQETNDCPEIIKEEPLIYEECFNKAMSSFHAENQEHKHIHYSGCSSSEPFPDVKLESIDDIEGDTFGEKKPEEESTRSLNYTEIQKANTFKCSLCSDSKLRHHLNTMQSENEIHVIMVGFVLHGKCPLKQAKSFISDERSAHICYIHFFESVNWIYEALAVKNRNMNSSCLTDLPENVKITIDTLCPQFSTSQFSAIFDNFVMKNIIKHDPKRTLMVKLCPTYCSVCSGLADRIKLKYTDNKDEKLVIMVGHILRGEYTLGQGLQFMSLKVQVFICHVHFLESVNEIYNALLITKPDDIALCSSVLLRNLMPTVNVLSPQLTQMQFRAILNSFAVDNDYIIRTA